MAKEKERQKTPPGVMGHDQIMAKLNKEEHLRNIEKTTRQMTDSKQKWMALYIERKQKYGQDHRLTLFAYRMIICIDKCNQVIEYEKEMLSAVMDVAYLTDVIQETSIAIKETNKILSLNSGSSFKVVYRLNKSMRRIDRTIRNSEKIMDKIGASMDKMFKPKKLKPDSKKKNVYEMTPELKKEVEDFEKSFSYEAGPASPAPAKPQKEGPSTPGVPKAGGVSDADFE